MTDLRNLLLEKIKENGSVTVAEYMALCLCHPEFGYYTTRNPFGAKGDFITAPEISQLFGEMIGVWTLGILQQIDVSRGAALVELGPGKGTMIADILRIIRKYPVYDSLEIHLVEISPYLEKLQRENLGQYAGKISWHRSIKTLPEIPMVILANEFFDALPVSQFAGSKEVTIGAKSGEFYFSKGKGNISEHSLESVEIMESLAAKIMKNSGGILVIDYGYTEPTNKSTLQAVKNHKFHDFLSGPGAADLTAHVNFFDLETAAEKHGLKVSGAVTQKNFLENIGIRIRAEALKKNANDSQRLKIDSALARLLDADKMGELFKVMATVSPKIKEIPGF